jgi:hypothetical protein
MHSGWRACPTSVMALALTAAMTVCLGTSVEAQSASGALGATQLNGLDNLNRCNAQANGAREKLMAQALQRKLKYGKDLSPEQRGQIEEDIAWLNAKATGSKAPAPNPRDPDRYLKVLTAEEQQEVNAAYGGFSGEVHRKCDEAYGSMTAYADPAGRVKKVDTRVPFPTLAETPPEPAPVARRPNCMSVIQGVRFEIMAERMERRLQGMSGLSAQERKAWEEDIAVVRAAATSDKPTMPQSPDPRNPMRYAMRLTPEDQMAVNQEYASRSRTAMANCTGGSSTAAGGSNWTVETSRTARRRAEAANAPSQAAMRETANAAAQAWMDAHPMAAPKEVRPTRGLGTTEADYLERSGTLACFDRAKGFRAKLMADRLTTKRDSVAPQERRELDAWIAAWRAAEQARAEAPSPPPGSNPNGDLRFLTSSDQQEINMANSIVSNKVRDECNSVNPFGGKQR